MSDFDPKQAFSQLRAEDRDVYSAVVGERMREEHALNLIASENYVSGAVKEALKSDLTNKYAEGYPGKRYYSGQKYTDRVEQLAIKRAKDLFSANFANVQPLSGAPANLAVYYALLEPGDTVLGMDLTHGGHLTHGHPVTLPADLYEFVRYGMADTETGEIDYDHLHELAKDHEPDMILAGFSAYPRSLDYERFVDIARDVGACAMMDAAHIAGLIAGGTLENPLQAGFDIMALTTHKTLRGPRGGMILSQDEEIADKIDKAVFPGLQGGPHMNTVAAKAVAFQEASQSSFRDYTDQIVANAQAMAEVFRQAGATLIAGGTENHLLLIDTINSFNISGGVAQEALEEVGITLNKNVIPDDQRSPMDPSGIRIGTPPLTTRGFNEEECKEVARLIVKILQNPDDESVKEKIEKRVKEIAKSHPIPKSLSK
jgi:glycine hydroxymethyltransferase